MLNETFQLHSYKYKNPYNKDSDITIFISPYILIGGNNSVFDSYILYNIGDQSIQQNKLSDFHDNSNVCHILSIFS